MDRISSLMDGELDGSEAQAAYARVREQPELRDAWSTFHLIGDAMRGEYALSAGFQEKLKQRLAEEPVILAPRAATSTSRPPRFMTYALSAAASVAAVAWVGWVAMSTNGGAGMGAENVASASRSTQQVSATTSPPSVSAPAAAILPESTASANDYLLAHQGVSPSTALQGVAPYVRTVSTLQPPAR